LLGKEKWYRDIGGGMGRALNAASAMDAYTLSDRGTWLSFDNKGSLIVAVEGDPPLLNRYDVIELDPQKHAGAKLAGAKVLADWLVSPEGQQAIGAYKVNGQKLFNPSAPALRSNGPPLTARTGQHVPGHEINSLMIVWRTLQRGLPQRFFLRGALGAFG
jgi:ABC-type tungstate transport system permease subunit